MTGFRAYIDASRPKTLPASLGPVLVGLALAQTYLAHRWYDALLIIICALLLQISANLINDYHDHKNNVDGSDRLGPKRASSSGILRTDQVQFGYRISLCLATCIGIYLVYVGGWPILVVGLSSLIFAYIYTAGPHPLSYIALGELLAFIYFGPVAVWGTWYIMSGQHSIIPLIVGIGPGSIALSIMAINNMRDRLTDQKSGKTTLAVLLGEKRSRLVPLIGIATSATLPLILSDYSSNAWFLLASVTPLIFMNTWRHIAYGPIDKSQNLSLASTGKYLLLYCLVLSMCLLI